MGRLVIVSNRVPLPSERGARAGGLAVALADALRPGALWFGWNGRHSATPAAASIQQVDGVTYATIDLSEHEYRSFYLHFANGALWPLLHFRLGLVGYQRDHYEGYLAANHRYAQSLKPLLRHDDLIWVHDYHLFPLADALRSLGVGNRTGFFLHTPFVPPTILRVLPHADELLRGLCLYDVIGFHTHSYRQSFLECVTDFLGVRADHDGRFVYRGRPVHAIVDPIGIDANSFAASAEDAVTSLETQQLRESLPPGRALAIGADRLDYSKGLDKRFEAFAGLLSHFPQHRRYVSFLQVAARSREDLGDYQRLRRELDRIVGDINGRFSEFDWVPLRYMTRAVRRKTLAGFFRIARLGMVTPLRDGMNLVAKEYVAAQDPTDPGVLILSRFAGAADELEDALIVNPFDGDEIAEAMHAGLTMPLTERQERWRRMRDSVWHNTAARYCQVFLSYLGEPDAWPQPRRLRAAS